LPIAPIGVDDSLNADESMAVDARMVDNERARAGRCADQKPNRPLEIAVLGFKM
jgi:hypothetical protein